MLSYTHSTDGKTMGVEGNYRSIVRPQIRMFNSSHPSLNSKLWWLVWYYRLYICYLIIDKTGIRNFKKNSHQSSTEIIMQVGIRHSVKNTNTHLRKLIKEKILWIVLFLVPHGSHSMWCMSMNTQHFSFNTFCLLLNLGLCTDYTRVITAYDFHLNPNTIYMTNQMDHLWESNWILPLLNEYIFCLFFFN